ncbi:MAG: SRPBCC family protein [Planctomycetales bacterium]|nr:SRPBCC family protein [Planctomycetales bacterium]
MPKYHVERSIDIASTAEEVFEFLSDFGSWTTWSPWLIAEPDAQVTVSADSKSVGSQYAWEGKMTGQGEIQHMTLNKPDFIEEEIRFLKPFKSVAKVCFHVKSKSNGCQLTWTMDGSLPWFMFWMVPMMKTFIGMDYQRGLNMIQDQLEKGAIDSKSVFHGKVPLGPLRMAGIAASAPLDDLGSVMSEAFKKAKAEFSHQGLSTAATMISVYTKFHMSRGVFDFICGYEIPEDAQVGPSLTTRIIPAGSALRVEHIGSYKHLGNAWSVANLQLRCQKLKLRTCAGLEVYRTVPPETPEAELQTDIYLPLK